MVSKLPNEPTPRWRGASRLDQFPGEIRVNHHHYDFTSEVCLVDNLQPDQLILVPCSAPKEYIRGLIRRDTFTEKYYRMA